MKILRLVLVAICVVVLAGGIFFLKKTTLRYSLVRTKKDVGKNIEKLENITRESIPDRFIRTEYIVMGELISAYNFRKADYLSYLSKIIALSYIAVISSGIGLAILLYLIYRSMKEIIPQELRMKIVSMILIPLGAVITAVTCILRPYTRLPYKEYHLRCIGNKMEVGRKDD